MSFLQNVTRAMFEREENQKEFRELSYICKPDSVFTEKREWLNMENVAKIKEY